MTASRWIPSALPVKHASRVRGPDGWTGPGNGLAARFGRDAAHAEWFYGFRLAIKTDLGSRIVRAWAIVPAAVNEREVAGDLLAAGPAPRDLLADKGFSGRAFAAVPGSPRYRRARPARTGSSAPPCPPFLRKVIAEWRNRIETTFSEITDRMELARHGAPYLLRASSPEPPRPSPPTPCCLSASPRPKPTHITRLSTAGC